MVGKCGLNVDLALLILPLLAQLPAVLQSPLRPLVAGWQSGQRLARQCFRQLGQRRPVQSILLAQPQCAGRVYTQTGRPVVSGLS